MNDIVVSIVCCTYNHEKYIKQALDSVLMQKVGFKFEILIHDDASTDHTQEIIKEYQIKYPDIIRPILQKENQYSQGKSPTLEYLLPSCKGKYIAVCEGDDYWIDENKLRFQIEFLEKNPSYVGCVHRYQVVDQHSNIINVRTFGHYVNESTYCLDDFFSNELPSQLASFVVRNMKFHSDPDYKSFVSIRNVQGDIKLFLYSLTKGNIFRMDKVMSAYRFVLVEGGNSWSSRQIGKPLGYYRFVGLCKLESCFNKIVSPKKYKFKERKRLAALETMSNLKHYPSVKTFIRAFLVFLKYPKIVAVMLRRKGNKDEKL